MELQEVGSKKKPLDLRIIVWLMMFSAAMHLSTALLLFFGVAHSPAGFQRRVCFGLLVLQSDVTAATYDFILGVICLVCAFYLAKQAKFGWWLMLLFSVYIIVDSSLLYADYPIGISIAIFFSVVIIIWLLCRRKLFHIGSEAALK